MSLPPRPFDVARAKREIEDAERALNVAIKKATDAGFFVIGTPVFNYAVDRHNAEGDPIRQHAFFHLAGLMVLETVKRNRHG